MTESQQTQTSPVSLFAQAEQHTERIGARIEAELAKWPMIRLLMEQFGGYVYNAGQKLIDRSNKTGEYRVRDQAICETCPRLFNDSFAGYMLARKGMTLQSAILLRSAFEGVTQAILFMENEDMAAKWLRGQQIKPREVRELTSMPEGQRKLYQQLCDLTHANYIAFGYASAPVPGPGTIGKVSFYGAWFAPKQAGQLAIQFLWAQLVLLEKFYETYTEDLQQQGLLWRGNPEDEPPADAWRVLLGIWRQELVKLTTEHEEKTPDDVLELSMAFSAYTDEEKEVWRQAYAEAKAKSKVGEPRP